MWNQYLQQLGIQCKAPINNIVTHASEVKPGDVFLVLNSGWQYIGEALERGAVQVISNRPYHDPAACVIDVGDTTQWLMDLATLYRQSLSATVIGITGSVGKTSLTQALKQVLEKSALVSATVGNQNNEIGVALTILAADPKSDYLIIEMGVAQSGDMDLLVKMASPDIACITRIGPSHLEGLKTKEGVLREKQKILLNATGVVLHESIKLENRLTMNDTLPWVVTFGAKPGADVRFDQSNNRIEVSGVDEQDAHHYSVVTPEEGFDRLETYCALIAICQSLNVRPKEQDIQSLKWPKSRMSIYSHPSGAIIIDDVYNANPLSYRVALQYMQKQPNCLLVLGEMGGLGDQSAIYHAYLGRLLNHLGFGLVWLIGIQHRITLQTYMGEARLFANKALLKQSLEKEMYPGRHILIKGSRHLKLEELFN
ncbi:MAG: UDP-N-acetylmuramoyl-tripeptide--D-alanyl-D-alanine ligase [Pseudomonadota bacterium]|nr:UDP-N-acetylmuramoyl-tripeptide--D-alanyl-D-alanine ligase [Pseudomonadota bacterium]